MTILKARMFNKPSTDMSLRQYVKVELLVLTTQFFGKAPDAMAELGEIVWEKCIVRLNQYRSCHLEKSGQYIVQKVELNSRCAHNDIECCHCWGFGPPS